VLLPNCHSHGLKVVSQIREINRNPRVAQRPIHSQPQTAPNRKPHLRRMAIVRAFTWMQIVQRPGVFAIWQDDQLVLTPRLLSKVWIHSVNNSETSCLRSIHHMGEIVAFWITFHGDATIFCFPIVPMSTRRIKVLRGGFPPG
jgi:hypothetical protein